MASILRALEESVHIGVNELYETELNMIRQHSAESWNLARKVFAWTYFTYSSLSFDQLLDALSVQVGEAHPDEENRVEPPAIVLKVCRGLVCIDGKSGKVRFTHDRFREYLNSRYSRSALGLEYIALVCLTRLRSWCLGTDVQMKRVENARRHPFTTYVVETWSWHLHQSDYCDDRIVSLLQSIRKSKIGPP